ncbi:MAG: hydrolase [Gemmatimonadaceae bacterium]
MSGPDYRPAWWAPGRHFQTMWGKFLRRHAALPTRAEQWDTPDGDFVELHRLGGAPGAPRILVLHGLEGSARSHYARGMLAGAALRGWHADVLVFRSCGSEPNRLARSYHSGETTDLDLVVRRLIEASPEQLLGLVGVSLGGNVLLKWLGECGPGIPPQLRGAVAISVPFDLARSTRHIDQGFGRVYQAHFLRSLKRKAHEKRRRFPDALSAYAIDRARTLYQFDDAVTAPIHGFRDADDYYERSSSIRWLERIRLPTLLLSAADDPFLPPDVLDQVRAIARRSPALELEFPDRGGHVGFVAGRSPWRPLYYAEWRAFNFLAHRLP